jgi:hypothetical protein
MEPHQDLLLRGDLVNYDDLPEGTVVIFVSHEWLSWPHPDPKGVQMATLCQILQRLADGELDVEMHPMHQMIYKQKKTTTKKEWKEMFADDKVYIWFDWLSMPQSAGAPPDVSAEEMAELKVGGKDAIMSIPAYIELSDFMLVVAPGSKHKDRHALTCYGSWRGRGWVRESHQ